MGINLRPTKPFFFCNMVYQGGWLPPHMNLKLTGPKYDCLVPWYRVASLLSIDTKIMKIGQRMTSQWRFQTWPDSKSGFSVKINQNWKKNLFFRKKVPNIGISPNFLLIKKGNGVSNMSWKSHTMQIFFFQNGDLKYFEVVTTSYLRTLTAHPTPILGGTPGFVPSKWPQRM